MLCREEQGGDLDLGDPPQFSNVIIIGLQLLWANARYGYIIVRVAQFAGMCAVTMWGASMFYCSCEALVLDCLHMCSHRCLHGTRLELPNLQCFAFCMLIGIWTTQKVQTSGVVMIPIAACLLVYMVCNPTSRHKHASRQ